MAITITRVCITLCIAACLLSACAQPGTPNATTVASSVTQTNLSGIKSYLTDKTAELEAATADLKQQSDAYYADAKALNFDYAAFAAKPDTAGRIQALRAAWVKASPLYEQMEGIVAGTPSLAQFDVDIDAGTSAAEDPEGAVSFDLTLPDGRVLQKPGNLFGVTESTLWCTFADYCVQNVTIDINNDGTIGFGDALPDANVLKGGIDELTAQATKLNQSAIAWQPTESDAFTALVVMVPTMTEYFNSWKSSRFIAGEQSEQRDFVAISRLADIQNILGSLQIVHQNVSPLIQSVDQQQDAQISKGLNDLKAFVADVYTQEQGGKKFSAEEADILGKEAQDRATAITGQITQMAAKLNITISE